MLRRLGWLMLLMAATTGAVACGGDDDDSVGAAGKGGKGGRAGSSGSGVAGDDGAGGDTSFGGRPGGSGGTLAEGGEAGSDPMGGVPIGGASGMGGGANNCTTSPPPLPACASATGCVACLCTTCSEAWTKCLADPGCTKAVACIAAGCSESVCASLTSGPDSLALAEAVDDCRSGKTLCRSSCSTSTGTGGASGAAGSGTTVTTPTCCEVNTEAKGCSGIPEAEQTADEKAVQACLCAKDAFCCDNAWDACCQAEISDLGCGPACPGADITTCNPSGTGGASGAAGTSGTGGASGTGGGSECGTCDFDKVCNPSTKLCEECVTSSDCFVNVHGPVCLGVSGSTDVSCGCTTNSDCKDKGAGPVCDSLKQYCGCLGDTDCAGSFFGKRCLSSTDPSLGAIKQCGCNSDADCPASSPSCHFSVCGSIE